MKTDMESTLRDGTLAASDDLLARATATVADMLEDTNRVATRLARYHTRLGDYAGSTFLDLNPNNPLVIEASDLFALSLLNVAVPASAARRVLEPGATSAYLSRLLRQDALSTDLNLAVATAGTFVAMRDLHAAVEVAIAAPQLRGSQSREAASKLLSRKRPDLFPGRDELVKGVLGLRDLGGLQRDWHVYQHLVRNDVLMAKLRRAVDAASSGGDVRVGYPNALLWHLEVALWTHAKPPPGT